MKAKYDQADKELLPRIKTIMVLRVIFLTGFMIMIFTFQVRTTFSIPLEPLSAVIGGSYFLLLIYALHLYWASNLSVVSSVQMAGDVLMVSGILFATGGIDSPFSFLYILIIVATSIILPRAACYLIASGAGICYGLLLDLEFFNIIHPVYFIAPSPISHEGGYVFYIIFINIVSYYSVAFLSSILSHRLNIMKDELALKSIDLQELQVFHKNVLQNMGNGLWTTDLSGHITSVNHAAADIPGYSAEEQMGKLCFELFDFPKLKSLYQPGESFVLPMQIEGDCRKKNGATIRVRMKISHLLEGENQQRGYICVFEDLTELREMEKKISQSEKLAEVGKISAGLAHEIRNPLASLSGSIQVLQKELKLEGTHQRLMEIVLRETERLNSIVSDFLSYSHPGKSRTTEFDLAQVIRDVITLLKNSKERRPETLFDFQAQEESALFCGDEKQIKQMVWNLCINGLQAMHRGGTLAVALSTAKQFASESFHSNREGIVLTVKDAGCGIPEHEIAKIFDPFFTTKETGVGLGLATVFHVVNQHDGYIGVNSKPNVGTGFTVFLPLPDKTPPNDSAISANQ